MGLPNDSSFIADDIWNQGLHIQYEYIKNIRYRIITPRPHFVCAGTTRTETPLVLSPPTAMADNDNAAEVFVYMGEGTVAPNDVVRVRIDPSVREIPSYALSHLSTLEEVELHDNLKKIVDVHSPIAQP
jgi:hypothetical protein